MIDPLCATSLCPERTFAVKNVATKEGIVKLSRGWQTGSLNTKPALLHNWSVMLGVVTMAHGKQKPVAAAPLSRPPAPRNRGFDG